MRSVKECNLSVKDPKNISKPERKHKEEEEEEVE